MSGGMEGRHSVLSTVDGTVSLLWGCAWGTVVKNGRGRLGGLRPRLGGRYRDRLLPPCGWWWWKCECRRMGQSSRVAGGARTSCTHAERTCGRHVRCFRCHCFSHWRCCSPAEEPHIHLPPRQHIHQMRLRAILRHSPCHLSMTIRLRLHRHSAFRL